MYLPLTHIFCDADISPHNNLGGRTLHHAKGLNSLRAGDPNFGHSIFCLHVDMYLLLTFFIFAITRDLAFSPVRQLQFWCWEAGSTDSVCFNSTVFCIRVQLQQSWRGEKKFPTLLTTNLSQMWPFQSRGQKNSYQYHCRNFLSQISDAQCSSSLETSVHFLRVLFGKSYPAQSSADLY